MSTWREGKDFKESSPLGDKEVTKVLKAYKINKCFELNYYLRNIEAVFKENRS